MLLLNAGALGGVPPSASALGGVSHSASALGGVPGAAGGASAAESRSLICRCGRPSEAGAVPGGGAAEPGVHLAVWASAEVGAVPDACRDAWVRFCVEPEERGGAGGGAGCSWGCCGAAAGGGDRRRLIWLSVTSPELPPATGGCWPF